MDEQEMVAQLAALLTTAPWDEEIEVTPLDDGVIAGLEVSLGYQTFAILVVER